MLIFQRDEERGAGGCLAHHGPALSVVLGGWQVAETHWCVVAECLWRARVAKGPPH